MKPSNKLIDWIFEGVIAVAFIAMWFYTFVLYSNMPKEIPVHFQLDGKVDRYGSKAELFIVPFIFSFITILFAYIKRANIKYNIPIEITETNREYQYKLIRRFLSFINIHLLGLALIILHSTKNALETSNSGMIVLPYVGLNFVFLIVYLVLASKKA
jgi:uncharacterized membrane protein